LEIKAAEVFSLAISGPPNLLFGLLKQRLGGRSLRNNEEVKIAVREWFRMQEAPLFATEFLKFVPR
jgi:hypothetical protein